MSLFSVQNCVFCVFFDPAFGCYTAINVCVNDPFALTDKADCDSKKLCRRPRRTDRQTDGRMNIMAVARRFVLTNASRANVMHNFIISNGQTAVRAFSDSQYSESSDTSSAHSINLL